MKQQNTTPVNLPPANLPPVNHFLMRDSVYSHVHWNPAATDTTAVAAWTGHHKVRDEDIQWLPLPTGIGTAFHTYPDGEEAAYFSCGQGVGKIRLTDGDFKLIDFLTIEGYEVVEPESEEEIPQLVTEMINARLDETEFVPPLNKYLEKHVTSGDTLMNGGYTVLDCDRNYYAGWGTKIYKIADEGSGGIDSKLRIVAFFDLKGLVGTVERLTGMTMTYNGYLVVAMPGIVAVLNRDLEPKDFVELDEDEFVDNGVSTDMEKDICGIYVVTSRFMRKLVWNGNQLSTEVAEGAWSYEYDNIPNENALSRGAGNTPTLMGFGDDPHKLVLIADAAEDIKVVAFWRNEIPDGFKQVRETTSTRVAGQIKLSIDVPATIEWSPHVYGYEAMVFASAWEQRVTTEWPNDDAGELDLFPTVMTAGLSRPAPNGAEKLVWDPVTYSFKRGWTQDLDLQWALHPISTASETVHLCGVEKGVYNLTAIDWISGREVGKTILGFNPIFNTMGGVFIPMENGDLFVTGAFGPLRIKKPGPSAVSL